jgi:hypothetical protein
MANPSALKHRVVLVLFPFDDHPSFAQTGLHTTSFVRLHRLTTVTTALIRRDLGRLDQPLINQVRERLRRLLGL